MASSTTADPGRIRESSRAPLAPGADDLDEVFFRVTRLMYDIAGVNLTETKRELVRSRLARRLRAKGWRSFSQYVDFVESRAGKEELALMVDVLTTNKTSFFREAAHFAFLRDRVVPGLQVRNGPVRVWSAGCSSGEEAYSLGILFREAFKQGPPRDVRILATDLSRRMLTRARKATYTEAQMEAVSPGLKSRYFLRVRDSASNRWHYQVTPNLRNMVSFAPLNLVGEWPMKGPFQVIFCRNVMIYFDREIRAELVHRFRELLVPDGYLFVGHSESLNGLSHGLQYVQPAVYRK